jgi:glycosyltransferase involved in cell wall biosynthesis
MLCPVLNKVLGIVFIEAMYYGLPVIAGNKDGSPEALLNGRLGTLIDPDKTERDHAGHKKSNRK